MNSYSELETDQGLNVIGLIIEAVGPIDLNLSPEECISMTGSSGSGKTLFLRSIADLIPHQGLVNLNGVNSTQYQPNIWRAKVGYLPAESHWWYENVIDHFSVLQEDWLQKVGFEPDVLKWKVNRLSSGEKQRLALLRLLSKKSHQVLLLDEPTSNLDGLNRERVEDFIAFYKQINCCSVIWVCHDSDQADRVSDRRYILKNGKIQRVN